MHCYLQPSSDIGKGDWVVEKLNNYFTVDLNDITPQQIIAIIEKWLKAVIGLDELLYEDAKKEFSLAVKTSFGADGSESEKAQDFIHVRGDFDNNQFVNSVLNHIKIKKELGSRTICALKRLT